MTLKKSLKVKNLVVKHKQMSHLYILAIAATPKKFPIISLVKALHKKILRLSIFKTNSYKLYRGLLYRHK